MKDEWVERFRSRGNTEEFINDVIQNWDSWMDELYNESCEHAILLDEDEYIDENLMNQILSSEI